MNAQHLSPLEWPIGWARARHRLRSNFGAGNGGVSVTRGVEDAVLELGRLRAREIVISTNVPLGRSGQFRGDVRDPPDTGAAVYFRIGDGQRVIATDKWTHVGDNLHAIALHIAAVRGQGRWGCGSIEQALGGYKMLTAVDAPKIWYEVLGLQASATWAEVERRRGELLAQHHPDRGGSHDQAAEINRAFENAQRAFEDGR